MPPPQDFLLFAAQAICHLGFRVAQCFPGGGGATHPLPTATRFLASSSSSAHPSSYSMGMPVSQGLNLLVGVPHADLYGSPRQPWGPSTVGPGHPQGRKALRPHLPSLVIRCSLRRDWVSDSGHLQPKAQSRLASSR